MSGSVARSLSDHKDRIESGVYGSILKTGSRVFAIQGFLVFLLGLALARFAPVLLDLPSRLHAPFTVLMTVQAGLNGGKLALGSLASPLWCHQRLDLSNIASSLSMLLTFAGLWLGFYMGWHVYSLSAATAVGVVVGQALTWSFCRRLGFYPPCEYRGRYDPRLFRELFHFGGSLFLMNLGAQLASASQVIVVSRLLGIEAAATWSIATKIFAMAQQFVGRILDSCAGGLAEMVVRNETSQLKKRFGDIVSISAVVAMIASSGIALMNGPFIEIWTAGKVSWSPLNNYLLACVLFCSAVTRCYAGLAGITKQIQGMKFVYLIEGVSFVSLSIVLLPVINLSGVLISALICNSTITGFYSIRMSMMYFGISWGEVRKWIARPSLTLISTSLFLLVNYTPFWAARNSWERILIGALFLFVVVIPAVLKFGIGGSLYSKINYLSKGSISKAPNIPNTQKK